MGLDSKPQLVGRDAELELIAERVASRPGMSGSTLVIKGEPGAGKSALLDAAEHQASGFTVLRTRGVDLEFVLPFAGLFDLFRPIFDVVDGIPHAQRAALQSALGLGAPVSVDRFAISTGTLALLSAAAEQRPVLVIIDDAQWLDRPSMECLLFASRRLRMDDVTFLWALRDGSESEPLFEGFDEIRPGPLEEQAARALVEEQRRRPVAPSVLRYLLTATNGNPLTLVEAVRAMSDEQIDGQQPVPRTLPLGVSAVQIFRRRIRALAPDVVRALTLLAVATDNDASVLHRAARLLEVNYAAAIEQLESASLVRIELGQPSLGHPLVRAALEHTVHPPDLRAAHRALARVLAERTDPTARAWHLAAAATQPDDDVAQLLEEAALVAQRRSAHGSAAVAFERSAGLTIGDRARAGRLLQAAQAARHAGRTADVRRLLEEATEYAGSSALQAHVECERGRSELYHGAARSAQHLLESAAARIEHEDGRAAAAMLGQAAFAAILTGDPMNAADLAMRARSLTAETREPIVELTLGLALLHKGDSHAMETLRQAAELTESRRGEVDPDYLAFAALALAWVGDFDRSRALIARTLPEARSQAAFGFLCPLLYAAAYLEARTGHLVQAYALVMEGVGVAEATTNDMWRYLCLCCLAYVEAARAEETACREHIDLALDLVRKLDVNYPATILDALGLLELALGHPEQAIAYLEPANVPAGGSEPTLGRLSAPDLVEAFIRAGRELPAGLVYSLAAVAEQDDYPSAAAAAERCRGLAAPDEEMDAHFLRSLDLHAKVGNPFAMARTEACYGERLRRAGRRKEAREHLRRAHAAFEDLGADHWATRVDAELRATGDKGRATTRMGLAQLTPQELQVALTVARGASNREAAAELYISPKTIEFHLHQVFRKLGVRSRGELAALVAQLAPAQGGDVTATSAG
ncbi:MAG TPA: AAA family ATPase [Actinomycetales bacterium]|jgi:DNA-binding CsgD family transcriptional regulator|nr:AAA family ATPase [Actinomycetales bacterium]